MKTCSSSSLYSLRSNRAGLALMEAVVYGAVMLLLLSLGFASFYRAWGWSKTFDRTSHEILRSVETGELWRADIRSAQAVIGSPNSSSDGHRLLVTHTNQTISYSISNSTLWRMSSTDGLSIPMLRGISVCEFIPESRHGVPVWRFELVLQQTRRESKTVPRFTFLAPIESKHVTP